MQEPHIARAHSCFRLDIRFPICIDDQTLVSSATDLLDLWHGHSYRIMRTPSDLLAHTRRVRLCHEPALQDRLLGALLDLGLVLDGNGGNLLDRLSREASPIVGTIDQSEQDSQHVKGRVLPTITQLLKESAEHI